MVHFLAAHGLLESGLKFRPMVLPDAFLDQDRPEKQYDLAGLNSRHIVATVLAALGAAAGAGAVRA